MFFFVTSLLFLFVSNVYANERAFVGICMKCGRHLNKNVTRTKTGNFEYRDGVKYVEYGVTVVLDCSNCDYHSTNAYTEFVKE